MLEQTLLYMTVYKTSLELYACVRRIVKIREKNKDRDKKICISV